MYNGIYSPDSCRKKSHISCRVHSHTLDLVQATRLAAMPPGTMLVADAVIQLAA